jgi:hypothetical protein
MRVGSRILRGEVAGFSRGIGLGFCVFGMLKSRTGCGFSAEAIEYGRAATAPRSRSHFRFMKLVT